MTRIEGEIVIGRPMDAFGRDGTRIAQNLDSRSREAPQCRSGRSQS
jgi:hypothetical protein